MRKKIVTTLLMSVFAFGAFGLSPISKHTTNQYIETFAIAEGESADTYYSGISDSATGETLRTALNTLNNKKRLRTIGYKQHRNYYKYTEKLPDTPSGKMYGFYDNALVSDTWDNQATWNHEHVWPDSLGGGSVDGDIHMPRPTSVKINSSRGNKYYAASGAYDPGQYVEEYRGVAARIIFYSAIANINLKIVDMSSGGGSNAMGKLSDLLKWNLQYLPTDSSTANIALRVEQVRNNAIASEDIQGNRNPFIDHPEYACRIWGNTNSSTQSICAQYSKPTLSISTESLNVYVDKEVELSGSMSDNSPIEWKIEDETIAQISSISEDKKNISIAGIKEGTTKITLSGHGEDDELLTKTCTITVSEINLTGITISNQKTKYLVGNQFVKPDVIARFSDNSTENVKEAAYFTGFDSSTAGEKTINVSYTFNGVTKQVSYKVTVSEEPEERVLSDIYFSSRPSKLEYKVGEKFDPTGLEVTAMYENGEEEVVTDKVVYETPTLDKAGEVHIIFSYTEGEITKTRGLVITVKGDKAPAKNGCGGNIATTSIVLTSIAAFGIATIIVSNILRKKRK